MPFEFLKFSKYRYLKQFRPPLNYRKRNQIFFDGQDYGQIVSEWRQYGLRLGNKDLRDFATDLLNIGFNELGESGENYVIDNIDRIHYYLPAKNKKKKRSLSVDLANIEIEIVSDISRAFNLYKIDMYDLSAIMIIHGFHLYKYDRNIMVDLNKPNRKIYS